jgi:hypothetical protein
MLSLIRPNLRLTGARGFDTEAAMRKPSLAFSPEVNQGGLLFLRQAKGIQLNFSQDK